MSNNNEYLERTLTTFLFSIHTETTEIYTLSLHDALPISEGKEGGEVQEEESEQISGPESTSLRVPARDHQAVAHLSARLDRKSTRLNSSHQIISYAVFCLKKKKIQQVHRQELYLHTHSSQ